MAEAEQTGPLTKPCPGCGVHMPAGYVKCPRCHTVLPATSLGPGRRRPTTEIGGGTTVEPGVDRNLLLIGGGAIVLIAIVAFLLARDGDSARAAPPPTDGSADEVVDDTEAPDTGDEPPDLPDRPPIPSGPPVEPPTGVNPAAAVNELGAALRGERLWASVTADGSTVVIQSSFCDDAGLTSIVDGHTGELRDAKFTAIRCRAPHGETVFEKAL